MSQPDLEQQVRIKNRKKLVSQNIKMYAQLKHLQTEIDRWDEQQTNRPEDANLIPLKAQIQAQEKEIRLLKEQVQAGRQGNLKENVIYIRKEENQLQFLKKELEKCQEERDLMHQGHQDKVKKLATNEPLIKHKDEIQNLWAQTKKQNRQNNLKIVELQREIRKFHSLKERAKDKDNSSNEVKELQHIQSQIVRMNFEIKDKQLKWKPNIEVLDNEFFTHKNTLQIMNKKLEELEKDEGVWKMRAAALRDQKKIEEDRDRLSKIVAMVKPDPPKKTENQNKFNSKQIDLVKRVEAVHKEVRNINKNDKYVELVRVQSSPSSSQSMKKNIELNVARKSIDFNPAQKSIKLNPIPLSPSLKGKKTQPILLPLDKLSSNKKDRLIDIPLSARTNIKNDQILEINKNGNNWVGRRDKQRIKSTIASDLAQKIKQKAEQVKKINQNMEKEKAKDPKTGKLQKSKSKEMQRSVSSPRKNRDTDKLKLRVQTDSQVILKPMQKQKSGSKLQAQIPSPKNKDKKDSLINKSTQLNQQSYKSKVVDNPNKEVGKKKNIETQKSQKNKPKELIQKIDINNKQKQSLIQSKNDKKPIGKQKYAEEEIKVQAVKTESKNRPQRLSSPKQRPQIKPKIDIFMNDLPKEMIPRRSNLSEIQRQTQVEPDQMQGVPKTIIRKKIAEGGQVTTGTST